MNKKPKFIERVLTPIVDKMLHAAFCVHQHCVACALDVNEEQYFAMVRDYLKENQK